MATAKLFASFPENLGGGNTSGEGPMDLLSDTIKVLLTSSTYTPNQTSHTVKSDVTNELSNGNGYTTGGETLGSKTYAVSSLVTTFDAADTAWTSATFTADNAVIYDDTPTSPADPLISYVDMGDQSVSAATFTLQWHSSGILTLTVA